MRLNDLVGQITKFYAKFLQLKTTCSYWSLWSIINLEHDTIRNAHMILKKITIVTDIATIKIATME